MLASLLRADGIACGAVYGAMDQAARTAAVSRFRSGAAPVLVVTDVAARGIDIPLLDAAINFDFPPTPKLFVHRAGRVARAGAAGDALSLVTRDDLGYLLDLHLFLGRSLAVAPQPGEAAVAQGDGEEASLLGTLPGAALEAASERARLLAGDSDELRALTRVSINAAKQYNKTRPPASAESVRRARELPAAGPHPPLLAAPPGDAATAALAASEAELARLAAQIGRYRPSATVLEAEVAPLRSLPTGGLPVASSRAAAQLTEVMKAKRAAHGGAIAARASAARAAEGRAPAPLGARPLPPPAPLASGRFRDSFFLDTTPRAAHAAERALALQASAAGEGGGGGRALKESVLDLMADDAEGAAKARSIVQWDARKRRYVSLHGGDADAAARRGNKRLRTESGALITGKLSEQGTGLYKKWAAKSKMRVVRPRAAPLAAAARRLTRRRRAPAQTTRLPRSAAAGMVGVVGVGTRGAACRTRVRARSSRASTRSGRRAKWRSAGKRTGAAAGAAAGAATARAALQRVAAAGGAAGVGATATVARLVALSAAAAAGDAAEGEVEGGAGGVVAAEDGVGERTHQHCRARYHAVKGLRHSIVLVTPLLLGSTSPAHITAPSPPIRRCRRPGGTARRSGSAAAPAGAQRR